MLPSLRRLPAAVGATRMTALRASAVGFHCGVAARGPIVVPSMGDSIREGSVVQVLKAVGEGALVSVALRWARGLCCVHRRRMIACADIHKRTRPDRPQPSRWTTLCV